MSRIFHLYDGGKHYEGMKTHDGPQVAKNCIPVDKSSHKNGEIRTPCVFTLVRLSYPLGAVDIDTSSFKGHKLSNVGLWYKWLLCFSLREQWLANIAAKSFGV